MVSGVLGVAEEEKLSSEVDETEGDFTFYSEVLN